MPNTTNYNWATPADTDLVKDGAAAIRTLGSSADTTVKNLNPGTTAGDIDYYTSSTAKARVAIGTAGQVLRVNSGGTAPEWATTADQTPLTTKGDLFTFDTADARLGVGANGTVLTADSAETTGLKWAAPAAPSFVGCSLTGSFGNVAISASTNTALAFDTEIFDTDGFHNNVTNNTRITIPSGKGGKYLFSFVARWAANATGVRSHNFFVNGSTGGVISRILSPDASNSVITNGTFTLNLNAADYVELYALQTSGGNLDIMYQSATQLTAEVRFTCTYLGA